MSENPTPAFLAVLRETIGKEGVYSNHPLDRGARTKFGITERVARACGYEGPMHELSYAQAGNIYWRQWWRLMRCDEVHVLSEHVAAELFDTGVNCGQSYAVKSLQRCLNIFNDQGRHYEEIEADGLMGAVTLSVLEVYLRKRGKDGAKVLYRAMNSLQGAYYVALAEQRPTDEAFVYGWIKNRVS